MADLDLITININGSETIINSWPCTINSGDTVNFISNVILTNVNSYFILNSNVTINGNYYGVTIQNVQNYNGLFNCNGNSSNITISNFGNCTNYNMNLNINYGLTINSTVTLNNNAGLLCYNLNNASNIIINNCYVISNISVTNGSGGIIGASSQNVTINSCICNGDVGISSIGASAGGFVGINSSNININYSTKTNGTIYRACGGFFGTGCSNCTVSSCYTTGRLATNNNNYQSSYFYASNTTNCSLLNSFIRDNNGLTGLTLSSQALAFADTNTNCTVNGIYYVNSSNGAAFGVGDTANGIICSTSSVNPSYNKSTTKVGYYTSWSNIVANTVLSGNLPNVDNNYVGTIWTGISTSTTTPYILTNTIINFCYASINGVNQTITSWPYTIPANTTITFITAFYFLSTSQYFIIGGNNITIDANNIPCYVYNCTNYNGLIQNGTSTTNGYSNITIQNFNIQTSGSTINSNGSWLCQTYFGRNASNITVKYCYNATGDSITATNSSSLFGSYCSNMNVYYCYNTGSITVSSVNLSNTGGLFGPYCSNINAYYCYNTGKIGNGGSQQYMGGLFGSYCNNINAYYCYNTGTMSSSSYISGMFGSYCYNINAYYCYCASSSNSTDTLLIQNYSGGLFNYYCTNINAYYCYFNNLTGGLPTDSGGIIGYYGCSGNLYNCYSYGFGQSGINSGSLCGRYSSATATNCCYNGSAGTNSLNNCIGFSNNWNDSTASSILSTGLSPNTVPSSSSKYGTIWYSRISYGNNNPYLLTGYQIPLITSITPSTGLNGQVNSVAITGYNLINSTYPISLISFGDTTTSVFSIASNTLIYAQPANVGTNNYLINSEVKANTIISGNYDLSLYYINPIYYTYPIYPQGIFIGVQLYITNN
jgi:hypothetical protein